MARRAGHDDAATLKAIVLGGTGLVGSHLLDALAADERFDGVVAIVRRPTEKRSPKIEDRVVDFKSADAFREAVQGDVLFSSLGTTLKKAGSKDAQYEVDYTFQMRAAVAGRTNGVDAFVLVSSMGANATSSMFYSRMKGELDRDVSALGFPRCRILRPGILDGDRGESRPMEKLGLGAMRGLRFVSGLKKYRPIHARTVAAAMIAASFLPDPGPLVLEAEELFRLGGAPL